MSTVASVDKTSYALSDFQSQVAVASLESHLQIPEDRANP